MVVDRLQLMRDVGEKSHSRALCEFFAIIDGANGFIVAAGGKCQPAMTIHGGEQEGEEHRWLHDAAT